MMEKRNADKLKSESHKEAVSRIATDIAALSTHLSRIGAIGNPKHEEYQEHWKYFQTKLNG